MGAFPQEWTKSQEGSDASEPARSERGGRARSPSQGRTRSEAKPKPKPRIYNLRKAKAKAKPKPKARSKVRAKASWGTAPPQPEVAAAAPPPQEEEEEEEEEQEGQAERAEAPPAPAAPPTPPPAATAASAAAAHAAAAAAPLPEKEGRGRKASKPSKAATKAKANTLRKASRPSKAATQDKANTRRTASTPSKAATKDKAKLIRKTFRRPSAAASAKLAVRMAVAKAKAKAAVEKAGLKVGPKWMTPIPRNKSEHNETAIVKYIPADVPFPKWMPTKGPAGKKRTIERKRTNARNLNVEKLKKKPAARRYVVPHATLWTRKPGDLGSGGSSILNVDRGKVPGKAWWEGRTRTYRGYPTNGKPSKDGFGSLEEALVYARTGEDNVTGLTGIDSNVLRFSARWGLQDALLQLASRKKIRRQGFNSEMLYEAVKTAKGDVEEAEKKLLTAFQE